MDSSGTGIDLRAELFKQRLCMGNHVNYVCMSDDLQLEFSGPRFSVKYHLTGTEAEARGKRRSSVL